MLFRSSVSLSSLFLNVFGSSAAVAPPSVCYALVSPIPIIRNFPL